jgi:hypothetical protein
VALFVLAGAIVGVLIGVALAGGGDGPDHAPVPPDLGIPRTTEPPPAATGATGSTGPDDTEQPATGTEPGGDAGTPSGGAQAPTQPDSPSNDAKPPPGSPASRFERFCEDNPGAC